MEYLIKINGIEIENIKSGFTLIDRIDEQFDSGMLMQLYTYNSDPFPPRSSVSITINSKYSVNYIVSADNVDQISYTPELYQHQISLISIDKKYDFEIMPSLAFTNKVDGTGYTHREQLERVRRVYPLETKYNHEATRIINIFDIDDDRMDEVAPELVLNRGTFYNALSSILQPLDLIPKVYNGMTLDVKKINKLNKNLDNKRYSNYNKSNSIEYYVGSTETLVDNAITYENTDEGVCWFPSKTTWVSFRSSAEGQLLSSEYYTVKLPDNIYKILSVKAKINITVNSLITGALITDWLEQELDLTDFIIEKDKWNLLDPGISTSPYDGRTKMNCAFYNYNNDSIDGFSESTKYMLLFTSNRLKNMLGSAYAEQTGSSPEVMIDYEKVLFRISYIPFTKGLMRSYKDSQLLSGNLNVSSSSSIVDFKRLGRNLKGMVNRLGNGDLSLKFKLKSYEDMINIGDYTDDGYIVTSAEKQFFDDHIVEIVTLTKNYNRISQYVGVNTEYRSYEIPRNGIIRHLHYDDFVVVSDNDKEGNSSFIKNLNWIYYSMIGAVSEDFSINNALVQTYEVETPSISTFGFNMDFEEIDGGGYIPSDPEIPEVPYIEMTTLGKDDGADYTRVELIIKNNNTFDVDYIVSGDVSLSGTLSSGESLFEYIEAYGNVDVSVNFSASGYEDCSKSLTHILKNGTTASAGNSDLENEEVIYIQGCWALTHSYSIDRAVCFSFGFNDTVKAGNATGEKVTGGYTQPAIKYTNDEGRFYYMDFEFYPSFSLNSNFLLQANAYPQVLNGDISGLTSFISTNGRKLVVDKDPSEIIKMTYQINFISENSNINIGNAFANRCLLTSQSKVGGLKLYIRDGFYEKNEINKITALDTFVENGVENISVHNSKMIKIKVLNGNKNWCLANDAGEIYLTCNNPSLKEIFIKPTHYFISRKEGESK